MTYQVSMTGDQFVGSFRKKRESFLQPIISNISSVFVQCTFSKNIISISSFIKPCDIPYISHDDEQSIDN